MASKLKISNVQNESYQELSCEIQILFILDLQYIKLNLRFISLYIFSGCYRRIKESDIQKFENKLCVL